MLWTCKVSQNCSVYLENICLDSKTSPLLFLVCDDRHKMSKGEDKYFRVEGYTKTEEKLLKLDGQNQDGNRLKIMIFRGDLQKSQHVQTKAVG